MKFYQINEDDLVELERTLPELQDSLMLVMENPEVAPRVRKLLGVAKRIIADVRWSYGPPKGIVHRVE